MATTSPDGLVSPNSTDPFNLISDWASSMASVQTALTNRASKAGTTSQRTSATNVREGTMWYDTTTNSLWRYNGSAWVEVTPGYSSGSFSPYSSVSSNTVVVRRQGNVVTIQGSVVLASGLSSNTFQGIGTIADGFRPPGQIGFGAYFYSPTGTSGAGLISSSGVISIIHPSGTRGAASFSASFYTN